MEASGGAGVAAQLGSCGLREESTRRRQRRTGGPDAPQLKAGRHGPAVAATPARDRQASGRISGVARKREHGGGDARGGEDALGGGDARGGGDIESALSLSYGDWSCEKIDPELLCVPWASFSSASQQDGFVHISHLSYCRMLTCHFFRPLTVTGAFSVPQPDNLHSAVSYAQATEHWDWGSLFSEG